VLQQISSLVIEDVTKERDIFFTISCFPAWASRLVITPSPTSYMGYNYSRILYVENPHRVIIIVFMIITVNFKYCSLVYEKGIMQVDCLFYAYITCTIL
jgi:hypothetical protein